MIAALLLLVLSVPVLPPMEHCTYLELAVRPEPPIRVVTDTHVRSAWWGAWGGSWTFPQAHAACRYVEDLRVTVAARTWVLRFTANGPKVKRVRR